MGGESVGETVQGAVWGRGGNHMLMQQEGRAPGGTWVGEAVLVLHQGDACNGTDHCGPHELQPNIQPLHGGTGSKLAPLV